MRCVALMHTSITQNVDVYSAVRPSCAVRSVAPADSRPVGLLYAAGWKTVSGFLSSRCMYIASGGEDLGRMLWNGDGAPVSLQCVSD